MAKIKYWTPENLLSKNCIYTIVYGERSNGKTYGILNYALEEHFKNGCELAIIRRMEEDLYTDFFPNGFDTDDVIYYLWQEDREDNYQGRFNFYLHISRNKIGKASMFLYMLLLTLVGIFGNWLWDFIKSVFGWFQ